jgi:hypothetical protein
VTFEILSGVTLWQRSAEVNNQEQFAFLPVCAETGAISAGSKGQIFC